ncbi:PREDICTED: centrosomal protein kizuna [Pseudopodoces humilis]|uniref:centrosomal protein kizuna n=1 Tax=Pseudopodoces humilis TaxID=181119 RepID=UPI0006B6D2E9|nr:PREDICTED: centrosomal protein kizuna [Pseudopodoces humilis]
MECTMADPHLVRQKQQRLQRQLAAVAARQQLALRRNRALRREFLQLEADMETTGWRSIRKMEWYGREIRSLLSLQEGSLSAGGDEEEGSSEQVLQAGGQAGIGTSTALPGELGRPGAELGRPGAELGRPGAELGHPTAELGRPAAAASAPGGLGSQQEPPLRSPSPELLSPDTGSTAGESEEEHGDLAASEEGSEQLTSASSGAKAAPLRPGQRQGSVPGVEPSLSSWWAHREGSRAKLPLPAAAEQETRPSVPGTRQEQGRDARAPEGSLLPPASPPTAQEEPLDISAPHSPELPRLCRALQLLERLVERTSPRHRALYQGQPSGTAEPPSAGAGGPAQDDPEAMEAVVLRQLRAVARHTRSGSVPAESGGAGQEEHTRDTEALRALLSHHGSFLKQHHVQLPEAVAEMFEQLLASGEEEQDGQAVPVLRGALPGERGDGSPVQSDESSLGLPAIPTNGGEGKQGELARREPGGDRGHDRPEGSDSLGHWDSSSSLDGSAPPFSRTELRKERVTAIKSKAFWGESDDSSSELEAALRPQTHGADSDDFDDFYD